MLSQPEVDERELRTREEARIPEEPRVSLLDILLILARRKRVWITCGLVCGVAAAIISYVLPVSYRAEADILPPQQATSSAAMLMGQVGNMLGMSGAAAGLGMKDPDDIILAILHSRSVADGLISEFDLAKVYGQKYTVRIEAALKSHSKIVATPDGVISIKVDDRDPKRAAAIANGYVEQLYKQNGRLAVTEAGQRRLFFEDQLAKEKDALADAEVALKQTQMKTGVIELQGQTELALRSVAELRAEISSSQVQLESLLASETPNNPDVLRLQEQIAALHRELDKAQSSKSGNVEQNVQAALPTSAVPAVALDYVRKLREVKYHETLFQLLARQYEAAKIDESKEAPAIQVIDSAVPPEFKYWPPRMLLTVAFTLIGLFVGGLWAIAIEVFHRNLEDPEQASKWASLKRAIWS